MAKIIIIPNEENLILDFKFYSPQQFFYTVTILNNSTGQIISKSKGQWDGKTSFLLGKAKDLSGSLLTIDWTISDPAGAGNKFNAEAIVNQNNIDCKEHQTCTGTTNNTITHYPTSGTFINLMKD